MVGNIRYRSSVQFDKFWHMYTPRKSPPQSRVGLRACDILCMPFKSTASVSHSPPAVPNTNPICLQRPVFWALIFLVQDPQAKEPDVGLRPPCALGRTFAMVIILLLWVTYPGDMGVDCIMSLSFLPIFFGVPLYSFSYRKSFLLVFGLFS